MEFSGKLLKRGFWLYIWDIKDDRRRSLYVGRTGDSSSPHASSPFRRIGQHLETRLSAKGNALGRQLKSAHIDAERCTFEMFAIGPIFAEQTTMPDHIPLRNKTAALERALADELTQRGYTVLGTHPCPAEPDAALFEQIVEEIEPLFPKKATPEENAFSFNPIRARDGASASQIILEDRGPF